MTQPNLFLKTTPYFGVIRDKCDISRIWKDKNNKLFYLNKADFKTIWLSLQLQINHR